MTPDRLAKLVFTLDAVLGILSIGGAAIYGAALSPGKGWTPFWVVFLPFTAFWLAFCFCAYKGLDSKNLFLKIVFWVFVAFNFFVFPVGTAISCLSIWLRREFMKQGTYTVSA